MRKLDIALIVLLVVSGLGMGIAAGCSHSTRADTIRATLVGLDATESGLHAYDEVHQAQLVAAAATPEAARADLAGYRAERDKADAALTFAYKMLVAAALADDAKSLADAQAAAEAAIAALKPYLGAGK